MTKKTQDVLSKSSRAARDRVEKDWAAFEKIYGQRFPRHLTVDSPRLFDYAWKGFQPEVVLAFLGSTEASYPAHKPLLFNALCTWTVCTDRPSLRQHGMLLVGIEQMRFAEALGRKAFPNNDLLGDVTARLTALGRDFYSDFYYPVGGLGAILKSSTPKQFARSIVKHSKDVLTVIGMMQILHYHQLHYSDRKAFHEASMNKATEAVERVFRDIGNAEWAVNRTEVKRRWLRLCRPAALSYVAASLRPAEGERSMLDIIRAGEASFEQHGSLVPTWLARTRFVLNTVLAPLAGASSFEAAQTLVVPPGEVEPLLAPSFGEEQSRVLDEIFKQRSTISRQVSLLMAKDRKPKHVAKPS